VAGGVVVGVDVIRLWALRIWPFPATCTIRSYGIRDDSVSAVNVVGWSDSSIAGTRRICQGETAASRRRHGIGTGRASSVRMLQSARCPCII
ncbi:uncharacterized protein METZ01_LOCUS358197, partial [marine metagenome]